MATKVNKTELVYAIRDYFMGSKKDNDENENRITLRSQVKQIADKYFLKDEDLEEITIEITDKYLPYIDAIFEDPLLNQNYIIEQDFTFENQVHVKARGLDL